jgi:hypothetical protein
LLLMRLVAHARRVARARRELLLLLANCSSFVVAAVAEGGQLADVLLLAVFEQLSCMLTGSGSCVEAL